MKKNRILIVIITMAILLIPQYALASESSITLLPGHNYVIEGLEHPWSEELHGVQPTYISYPAIPYTVGVLSKGISYDLFSYDGFSSNLRKGISDPLTIKFETESDASGRGLVLVAGGKTYFTINSNSPQSIFKYNSTAVRISETSYPTLYLGTMEPGKTYEFVCNDTASVEKSVDFKYIHLAFDKDVSLNVNGEVMDYRAYSESYDSLGLDEFSNYSEDNPLDPIKTVVIVPPAIPAINYYAPGENFIKYITISGQAVSGNDTTINDGIQVLLDGEALNFDVPPTIINGRTLVPLRAIFEAMGANIQWDNDTRTVTATKDDVTIILTIGNTTATVNGRQILLDVPGTIVNSRTMVPARFIAESLGAIVDWNGIEQKVIITSK